MESKCQYLFVVEPPAELANEVHKIRMAFAEKYNCKAALKPPVHITLIPNFWVLSRFEAKLSYLHEWAATLKPFEVSLRNFGTFPNNGVVFIDVEKSDELEALHKGLSKVKDVLPSGTFRSIGSLSPHITIGYRDIPPKLYEQAAAEYRQKTFSADFIVNSFQLWKHNGKRWETLHTYKMEGSQHKGELFM